MQISFRTNKLRRQYEHAREAERAYGKDVAKRYIQRINTIKRANDIDELKRLPEIRCHQLKGERKGEWALNLTGYYRLIFTLHGEQLEIARIEEVSRHYED